METNPENIESSKTDNSLPEIRKDETEPRDVDAQKLKGIYEKCTSNPEDKNHKTPLWGRHVTLSEEDIDEVRALEGSAREQLDRLTSSEPLWDKYISLEAEGGKKGILFSGFTAGKIEYLVEDPDATDVAKTITENGLKGIKMPSVIANMVRQRNRLGELELGIKQVEGTEAQGFGHTIKETYRFYKDNSNPQEGELPSQAGGN